MILTIKGQVPNKTMENKQTAVEWFVKMLYSPVCNGFKGGTREIPYDIIQQAKSMEKQQIIDAHVYGDENHTFNSFMREEYANDYYNETYVTNGK